MLTAGIFIFELKVTFVALPILKAFLKSFHNCERSKRPPRFDEGGFRVLVSDKKFPFHGLTEFIVD